MRRIHPNSRERQNISTNHEGTWAVSYGDMITLLLAFFILFFSVTPPEDQKTLFSDALVASFLALDQSQGTNPSPSVENFANAGNSGIENVTSQKNSQLHSASSRGMSDILLSLQKGLGLMSDDDKPIAITESAETDKEMALAAKSAKIEVKAIGAEIQTLGNKVVITFPEISFFPSASTDLSPQGIEVLKKFTETYLPFAGKNIVNIVGFADPRPVLSQYRFRDNLELSVLRAVSAQRLMEEWGIPLARTRLMGHGVKHRLDENEQAISEGDKLALSRKIMLIIEPEEERS